MNKRKLSFNDYESVSASPNAKKMKLLSEKIIQPSKIASKKFSVNEEYNYGDNLTQDSVWDYVQHELFQNKMLSIREVDCIFGKYKCKMLKYGSEKVYYGNYNIISL